MLDKFEQRLNAIDWSRYETAYGPANKNLFISSGSKKEHWGSVADQLTRLASRENQAAMQAAHHLWCGLCHQHAYVSSAALPALPFILEVLDQANDELAVEILDILVGFAACSVYPKAVPKDFDNLYNWNGCRKKLRDHFGSFSNVLKASSEQVAHVSGLSEETAIRIYEWLHPQEPDAWMHDLRQSLQDELPRFTSLTPHPNEELSYFAREIVSLLTIRQEVTDVEIEIYVKYLGNKAEHDKAETSVRETLRKLDCMYDGYLGSARLLPGAFTRFSIRAPKPLADRLVESLTGSGLTAGSYAKRYNDVDVPL